MKVSVDTQKCLGYANCIMEAPEVFDLDDATNKVVLLADVPDESMADEVRAAERDCPTGAITVDE